MSEIEVDVQLSTLRSLNPRRDLESGSEDQEYEQANEWWRKISEMRRHDLAAFTAIQGAALTVIGDHLLDMKAHQLLVSLVAFVVLLVGYNNERRLSAFLEKIVERSCAIEQQRRMTLLSNARDYMNTRPGIVKTTRTFGAFYVAAGSSWVVIWLMNIMTV
jgi:hypothetical protein